MKSRWIIGFLLTCALAVSANAQQNSGEQSAEGPIANFARQNSGARNKLCHATTSTRRSAGCRSLPGQVRGGSGSHVGGVRRNCAGHS